MQNLLPNKELLIEWESSLSPSISLKIGFLDNPFVEKYIDSIESNIIERELETTATFASPFNLKEYNKEALLKHTDNLSAAITDLNSITTKPFPVSIEELKFEPYEMYGRTLLNRVHRAFAFCWLSKWTSFTESKKQPGPNLLNLSPERSSLLFEYLERINKEVHEIETFWYSKDFSNRFDSSNVNLEYNITFKDAPFTQLLPRDEIYRVNEGGYDVWVSMIHMTGKNYFSCFYDLDDPSMPDIIMENNLRGSIGLGTRSILGTPTFIDWFKEYNMEPEFGIPLGYIIEGRDNLDTILKDFNNEYSIKNISF